MKFKFGDCVLAKEVPLKGRICELDSESGRPYKVQFTDGTILWFYEDELELAVQNPDEPADERKGEE